jgi:hypothetical protein
MEAVPVPCDFIGLFCYFRIWRIPWLISSNSFFLNGFLTVLNLIINNNFRIAHHGDKVQRRKVANSDELVTAQLVDDVATRNVDDAGGESVETAEDVNDQDGDPGDDSWDQYNLTGVTRMFSILPYNVSSVYLYLWQDSFYLLKNLIR